jgi:enoyl-CoA hydratase/carnithine racemase
MSDMNWVRSESQGPIAILTLNQPERRNPISNQGMVEALVSALEKADRDPALRVAILTGAGTAFSAGGDLQQLTAGHEDSLIGCDPGDTPMNYRQGIQRIPRCIENLGIPVIAAVNGPAVGAGCDLACACDIRIGSDRAMFSESFVALGLIPGDGGSWLLPRIVGFARATQMALTAERIDGQTALSIGLLSEVTTTEALLPRALELAQMIAEHPREAVRATRQLLRRSCQLTLDETLALAAAEQALAHEREEHRTALARWVDKIKPS